MRGEQSFISASVVVVVYIIEELSRPSVWSNGDHRETKRCATDKALKRVILEHFVSKFIIIHRLSICVSRVIRGRRDF